jgi:hypothetical protein
VRRSRGGSDDVIPLSAGAGRGGGWRDVKVADPRVRACQVGAGNLHLMIAPSAGRARQALGTINTRQPAPLPAPAARGGVAPRREVGPMIEAASSRQPRAPAAISPEARSPATSHALATRRAITARRASLAGLLLVGRNKKAVLTAYWITFPDDLNFPIGVGVTAHSREDALRVLEAAGFEFHRRAKRIQVREDVSLADLDPRHVVPNMGPIVVRGVWCPFVRLGA